jgi:hypothetical protein
VTNATGKSMKVLKELIWQASERSFYHIKQEMEMNLKLIEADFDREKLREKIIQETAAKFEAYLKTLDNNP